MQKSALRPLLLRIFFTLQMTTVIGIFIIGIFVVNFSSLRISYAFESWWIIAIIAAVLVTLHGTYALSIIAPAREVDDEIGFAETTPTEARRALESILTFIPRAAILTCFNWVAGGIILGTVLWFRYPVTLREVIAVILGSLCAGLLITVVHYHGVKLNFQEIISLLMQRAGVQRTDDPLFERHRAHLRHELQIAFATLIIVVMIFGVMYGHTQTAKTVRETTARQSDHTLNIIKSRMEMLSGETTDSAAFERQLLDATRELRPSPHGSYFFVRRDGSMVGDEKSIPELDESEKETLTNSEGSDWLLSGKGYLLIWRKAWDGKIVSVLPPEDQRVVDKGGLLTLLFLFAILLAMMLGISNYVSQSITRPLLTLNDSLVAIASGDLTADKPIGSFNEVGELGLASIATIRSLKTTIEQITTAHQRVDRVAQRVEKSTGEVRTGSTEQADHLTRTLSALEELQRAIQNVTNRVEELSRSSENAQNNVQELNQATKDVEHSATEVGNSVEETGSSIFQMAASINTVAESMRSLREAANDTSRSVSHLANSIRQVESEAMETSVLSQQVLTDAEAGAEAITLTMGGIENIREATKEAVRTIETLGRQMEEIGGVLTMIDEVAGQTQLLSLNAAIIAAQAGEHGEGFAVVADEIKKLSVRTAAGTKEIGELLHRIQQQARKGVEKVKAGEEAVQQGSALSERAREALAQIEASAGQTTERMARIAQATQEQGSGINLISRAVEQMVEMVDGVTNSTGEQQRGANRIAQASESLRGVSERVGVAARRQGMSSSAIQESMTWIVELVGEVLATTRTQIEHLQNANESAEQTGSLAGRNLELTEQLRQVVVDLTNESKALTSALSRFKLG